MSSGQNHLSAPDAVLCSNCATENDFTNYRKCIACGHRLRPIFLDVLTAFGILGAAVNTCAALLVAILLLGRVFPRLVIAGLDLQSIGLLLALALLVGVAALGLFALAAYDALRSGRLWGWRAVQILWLAGMLLSFVQVVDAKSNTLWSSFLLTLPIILAFFVYMHSHRVKVFCRHPYPEPFISWSKFWLR
jgi:hypothetical protein